MGLGRGWAGMWLGLALAAPGSAWAGMEWAGPPRGVDPPYRPFVHAVEISAGDYLVANGEGGYARLDSRGNQVATGKHLCELTPDSIWVGPGGIGVLGRHIDTTRPGGGEWVSFRYLDRSLRPSGPVFDLGYPFFRTPGGFLSLRHVYSSDSNPQEIRILETALDGRVAWSTTLPRGRDFRFIGLHGIGGEAWICSQVVSEGGVDSVAVDRIDGSGRFLGRSAWPAGLRRYSGPHSWIAVPHGAASLMITGAAQGNDYDTLRALSVGRSGTLEGYAQRLVGGPTELTWAARLESLEGGDAWITLSKLTYVILRPGGPAIPSMSVEDFRYSASTQNLISEIRPAPKDSLPPIPGPCEGWTRARDGRGNEMLLGCQSYGPPGHETLHPAYLIRREGSGDEWRRIWLREFTGTKDSIPNLRFLIPTQDGGALVGGSLFGMADEPRFRYAAAKLGPDYIPPVSLRRPLVPNKAAMAAEISVPRLDILGRGRSGRMGRAFLVAPPGP